MQYFLRVDFGSRTLQASADSIAFGSMRFCETRDTTITLKSLGCDQLIIDSILLNALGGYSITTSPTLPYRMLTNDSTAISLHFDPTTTGNINGTLTIKAEGEPYINKNIPIKAYVIPTDTVVFDFQATRPDISAGDTVSFVVLPGKQVRNKNLHDVVFTVNYNGDLLTFLPKKTSVLIQKAAFTSLPTTGTPKHSQTRITLVGLPTLEFDAGMPLMSLVFVATLTDSITTTMNLSDVVLNDGEPNYSKCTLGIISSSIDYTIALHCGDETLVRYMQLGDAFTMRAAPIVPDPLNNTNSWKGDLPFVSNLSGNIILTIYDPLGREVFSDMLNLQSKGGYHFRIDGANFSSGLYHYMLRHQESGTSVSGKFSVIR
jgi:hypothetical protein